MAAMKREVTVRLPTRRDLPFISALAHELADVEGMASSCTATVAALQELLFTRAPFHGPTVFMLEIGGPGNEGEEAHLNSNVEEGESGISSHSGALASTPELAVEMQLFRSTSDVRYRGKFLSEIAKGGPSVVVESASQILSETHMEEPVLEIFRSMSDVNLDKCASVDPSMSFPAAIEVANAGSQGVGKQLESHKGNLDGEGHDTQVIGEVALASDAEDADLNAFKSTCEDGSSRIVIGFVHFFPNYSTYLAKAGLYIDSLYIREPYRRRGLGRMLFRNVAQEAVKRGMERMEWRVLYTNEPAIHFYEGLGAGIKPGFRSCSLEGNAILKCKP